MLAASAQTTQSAAVAYVEEVPREAIGYVTFGGNRYPVYQGDRVLVECNTIRYTVDLLGYKRHGSETDCTGHERGPYTLRTRVE